MGKQRFALLGEQLLAVAQQGQPHVAQGQTHHAAAGRVRADEAAQTGLRRHDGMPRLPRQLVAAAVAAGGRVADAAGGYEGVLCPQCLAPVGDSALADAVLQQQLFSAAAHKFCIPGIVPQGRQHIGGAVALGKDPAAALGLQRHAQFLKQLHGRGRREGVQAGIQEPPVMPHVGQKLPHVAVAGDVAAALAGNEQLLPRAFGVVLQHRHCQALGAGRARRHQACGASADDQ